MVAAASGDARGGAAAVDGASVEARVVFTRAGGGAVVFSSSGAPAVARREADGVAASASVVGRAGGRSLYRLLGRLFIALATLRGPTLGAALVPPRAREAAATALRGMHMHGGVALR